MVREGEVMAEEGHQMCVAAAEGAAQLTEDMSREQLQEWMAAFRAQAGTALFEAGSLRMEHVSAKRLFNACSNDREWSCFDCTNNIGKFRCLQLLSKFPKVRACYEATPGTQDHNALGAHVFRFS